jgi:protocatechuate 3,4-dioxygenase alpha subunit
MRVPATTSQTVGPYFKVGFSSLYCDQLADADVSGERITIQGHIFDGEGHPVPDAVLEMWQADAYGNYSKSNDADQKLATSGFFGFGRIPTDSNGAFRFSTIKPGSVPGPDGSKQAPHIVVSLFMRGLLIRLVTRIYFAEDPLNERDFVLQLIDQNRRSTLMAAPVDGNSSLLEWDVNLQGEHETAFFDF